MKISFLALGFAFALPAFASTTPPVEESSSRALQQARRVAAMENGKDLPSRAVWLSRRVAKNSHLAYVQKTEDKASRKKNATSED